MQFIFVLLRSKFTRKFRRSFKYRTLCIVNILVNKWKFTYFSFFCHRYRFNLKNIHRGFGLHSIIFKYISILNKHEKNN